MSPQTVATSCVMIEQEAQLSQRRALRYSN